MHGMHDMGGMHGMGGMPGMYLMYASGKALVALAISARTWLASLQPNMGSLYIDQYLRQTPQASTPRPIAACAAAITAGFYHAPLHFNQNLAITSSRPKRGNEVNRVLHEAQGSRQASSIVS